MKKNFKIVTKNLIKRIIFRRDVPFHHLSKNQKSKISINFLFKKYIYICNQKIEIIILAKKKASATFTPDVYRALLPLPSLVDPLLEFTYWRDTGQSSVPSWTNTRYLSLA